MAQRNRGPVGGRAPDVAQNALTASPEPLWRPSATLEALQQRAHITALVRRFFADRQVLEVSTPVMGNSGPRDLHLELMRASFDDTASHCFYLQPSPESAMKRLLAAGSGAIYQLGPAMRAGERGARHNPEFTMLEWYRPGFDLCDLMDEVDDLLALCLRAEPGRRTSYQTEFKQHTGLDPFAASTESLVFAATESGLAGARASTREQLLDFLFSERVERSLGRGVVHVHGFPPEQAAMAQVADGVAQRVEVYVDGVELANGYLELTDEAEQRRRFELQGAQRTARGQQLPPMDEALLHAMKHGLPEMCGMALGIDRLIMRALGAGSIDEVIAFAVERA